MVDIYQNGSVSIAAVGAPSAEHGLFSQRDPLTYAPCRLFRSSAGKEVFAFHKRDFPPAQHFRDYFHQAALHRRGLVMQEQLLAPRTINFGSILVWECRERYFDEHEITREAAFSSGTLKGRFFDGVLQPSTSELTRRLAKDIHKLWYFILDMYSQARLTVKSDRLIALSGTIRAIKRRTGWENIFGLWRPFLIKELLWSRSELFTEMEPTKRYPTWSWVATNDDIFYVSRFVGWEVVADGCLKSKSS
jgi:hypothetical protein